MYTTKAGDGSIEQRTENAPNRTQRNSNYKMQFSRKNPCAKGKASIYMKKCKKTNVYAKNMKKESFITEEILLQRVQT